ncbi:MAG: UDP-N-acetylmuramoyl-L-alanyl-D-glutamate--2,6-diaminopimelate ligase, partial [Candidatus Latescibacteria bacterium]|nr:UDP-N-acetylmuramoyl-L-alanyl-D-glutamate--2,6-diaminopimelate ligase [Candidatus Latescibacterota bacterium]
MHLQDLLADLPDMHQIGEGNPEISGLCIDSRTIQHGEIFVAMSGERSDGHQFVDDAFKNGASAAVVENPIDTDQSIQIRVPSTRRANALLANRFYQNPSRALQMVGVTGTNGKTSTVYLIQAILKAAGQKPGLIGTIQHDLGNQIEPSNNSTPEAHDLHRLFRTMVNAGCHSAVMEATSHGLALDRVYGIAYDVAVFTNLTRDHLDYHKTPEAYLAAKALLFDNLSSDAHAIVNVDDASTDALLQNCSAQKIGYGQSENATVRILNGQTSWQGTTLTLQTPGGRLNLDLSLQGNFQLYNTAAAVSVGLVLDIAPNIIANAIREVRVPGRFEGIDCGQNFGVFVDYAHAPDGLKNVLQSAREFTSGKLICVFGCGGDRDRGKRPVMGQLSAQLADLSVVTSDNPRTEDPDAIIAEILPGVSNAPHIVESDRRR